MDPLDETDRPVRPRRPRLPYVALQERAVRLRDGLRDGLRDAPAAVQGWDDDRRTTSFVPSADTVVIDVRRHAFVLIWPLLRTIAGLLVLATGASPATLLALALAAGVWARVRFGTGLRRTAVAAGAATLALVGLLVVVNVLLVLLLLLLWLAEDVADWMCDRLVVTDRRIYRRYGVFTRHSPSIALTAIAFIDAAVPPLGHLLHYGTLRLDSVAQRDAPLARMDYVPGVVPVSHEILRLRSLAMPKFPQQPY